MDDQFYSVERYSSSQEKPRKWFDFFGFKSDENKIAVMDKYVDFNRSGYTHEEEMERLRIEEMIAKNAHEAEMARIRNEYTYKNRRLAFQFVVFAVLAVPLYLYTDTIIASVGRIMCFSIVMMCLLQVGPLPVFRFVKNSVGGFLIWLRSSNN